MLLIPLLIPFADSHKPSTPGACSWNGSKPVTLDDGSQRSYLLDGDTGTGVRGAWGRGSGGGAEGGGRFPTS